MRTILLGTHFKSRLLLSVLFTTFLLGMGGKSWGQTATRFNDGYLTVFKVTSSAALTSTGTAIVMEEYLPTGVNQTVPNFGYALPSSSSTLGANDIVISGTGTAAGEMSRSENGRYLIIPGYRNLIGDANTNFTTTSVVRTLSGGGTFGSGISGANYSSGSNNLRGATSDDGTYFWTTGNGLGILGIAASSPTTVTNVSSTSANNRACFIYNGQLYLTSGAGNQGIYSVGTGKPTTAGNTATRLFTPANTDPYGFSLSPDGLTLYYVAANTGGIYRSVYSSGAWSAGTLLTGTSFIAGTGITVDWRGYTFNASAANGAIIYASNPTTIIAANDNGTSSVTITTLRTITGNNAFRGLAFSPIKQTVSLGAATPAAGAIAQGLSNAVLYQFNLSADEGNSTIKKLVLTQNGTATLGTGNSVSNLRLIYDADGNGVASPAEISAFSYTGTVTGSIVTFSGISQTYIAQGSSNNYLVIGDISATGTGTIIPAIVSNKTINSTNYTTNVINAGQSPVNIGSTAPTGNTLTITAACVNATIVLSSATGTDNQTVPQNSAITNITYAIGGGGTGATVTGLPAGVTGTYSGGTFTISGSPTATPATYNYTVTATGGCNNNPTATGSIIVTTATCTAPVINTQPSTAAQNLCQNAPATALSVAATGTSLTYQWYSSTTSSNSGGTLISGATNSSYTPVTTATGTLYYYVIVSSGACTTPSNPSGAITVTASSTITLSSAAGTDNQTVTQGNAITNITYPIGGGGTGGTVTGLPAGVTGTYSGGVVTISGTPTATGTFSYMVTATGGCNNNPTAAGTITVNPCVNATITLSSAAGTDNQSATQGVPITNITYTIGGGGTGATVTGLPTGVTGTYSAGVETISGTPTVAGPFTYTVTAMGGCNTNPTATGTITVCGAPTTQSTNITFTNVQANSLTVNWTIGNGSGRVVYINTTSTFTNPVNSSTALSANPVYGGSGQQVVYNGTGNNITVSGLTVATTYYFKVYEYNVCTGTYIYYTGTGTNNPLSQATLSADAMVQSGFTSVLTPQYMISNAGPRFPIMFRATVTGLTASTTYRYYVQGAIASDLGGVNSGAGNPLLINSTGTTYTYSTGASLSSAGNYETFTTNASGSYTGWFGFVNTGNVRFLPGTAVYPAITIGNTSGTTLYRRAMDLSVTPLTLSSTATATNGSFFQSVTSATPKNLVAVFDNTTGTGRPLSVTPVENIGAAIATVAAGYSTSNGAWNAIIPNTNTNGIRFIEQLSVTTGNLVGCVAIDADGTWPTGNVVTASPTNGATVNAISGNDDPLVAPTITTQPSTAVQSTCQNGTAFTALTVAATSGTITYQWYSNTTSANFGGTAINGATTASYTPVNTTVGTLYYYAVATNNSCSTASNPSGAITVTAPVSPSVSLAVSPSTTICAGTSVTFTATPTNGGATPNYNFQVNGGSVQSNTTNTYTTNSLNSDDVVSVVLTSAATCITTPTATSNSITMTVNPNATPTVAIAVSPSNSVCAGTSITFTATPTNGGTTPVYQWKVNGNPVSATGNTYTTSTLNNGDVVTVVLTSNATCVTSTTATSNSITMTVNANVTPTVSLSASPSSTICAGTAVTFTATATDGGASPGYDFRVGGISQQNSSSNIFTTSTLNNNDVVTVVLTSNATCATTNTASSNSITMTVNPNVVPSVSIVASPSNSICSGTTVTFTATPVNEGSSPFYQWKVGNTNVGTNSPTYSSSTLGDGDEVTCVLTSNATCAVPATITSNKIGMAVDPNLTPSVTIAASPTGAICIGTSVTFTAIVVNGGSPAYQWYLNGTAVGGETNSAYTTSSLSNGDAVKCIITSSITCAVPKTATSNTITESVNSDITPSVTIAANPGGTICAGTSVTFTANSSGGGNAPMYNFRVNGTTVQNSTSNTYTTTTLADGNTVDVILTSNATCITTTTAASSAITMSVTTPVTPSVSIVSSATGTSCSGSSVTFTATPTNGGSTPSYQWQLNGADVSGATGSTYTTSTLADNNTVDVVLTTSLTCVTASTATSNIITASVTASSTITLSSAAGTDNQTAVQGIAITPIIYAIGGGGTGASVTGLPTGVTGIYSSNVFTISGTPTVTGTFNYITTATGGCNNNPTATGTITVCSIPTQDTGIVFTTVQPNNMTVRWTVGNGTGRVVLMNKTNNFTNPANSTTLLSANPAYSGAGQQVVYNGSIDSVIVSNLLPGTNYWFRVYEYNNCSGTYIYDTASAPHNPNSKTTAGAPLVQSNFISVLTSKYIAASSNTARLPIMFRATVIGLKPNANYRYYTNTATNSTAGGGTVDFGGTNSGAGNPIFVNGSGTVYKYAANASLSAVSGYDSLTTDASGKYTGWFGILETNNARFTAGNVLYPTITLGDTAGVPIFRYVLNDSMMALAFSTSAGANNGSFLQSKTTATPKNLVAIFDNTTGSGKPLYIAPVEYLANTGSGFNTASTGRIAAYDSSNGAWNAIIPNTNANGVRLIEQLSVTTGSLVGCAATDADGIWTTGNISTVNPANGTTAKIISGKDDPLATCAVYPNINVQQSGTSYASGSTFTYSSTNINTNNDVTFTIQNTGTDTLKIASIAVSGTAFSLQGTAPASILAGGTATFVVRFSPTAATSYTGAITINDNVPNQATYSITLNGTGVIPLIPVIAIQQNGTGYANNSTYTYSSTIVNSNNDVTFTIQNTGNTTLTISSIDVSGAAFSLQGTAPASVAAGSTATFVVRFAPTSATSYTGAVTINSNDPNQGTYLINLNGTGSTATITTGTISGSPFCVSATSGASVSVPFTYTPAINFTGTFTAQLSSASGSFASPVSIGTISSDGSGSQTIAATLPAGTAAGTGYRIRVISSIPAATGSSNGSNLTVTAPVAPTVSIAQSPAGTICAGSSVMFTATPTNGGITPAYQWQLNGSDIPGETGSTYTTSTLVSGNQVDVVLTSSASCVTTSTATSNIITVTVTAPSSVTLSSIAGTDNQSVTQGNAITPITYAIGGGGTGATITGLPTGVTGNYSSGVFTISGTPGVAGLFTYTVTATGGCNNNATATGTITVCGAPSKQDSLIVSSNVLTNSMTVGWTNGNGSGRVVYINTTNSFINPTNGTTMLTANPVYSGSGQQVVYNGTGNSVSVSGLIPNTGYYFKIFEYNSCTGTYFYNINTATSNPSGKQSTAAAALIQSGFISVLTPKFMPDSSGTNVNERLPVMFRASVTGLTPNTQYRYFVQGNQSTDFGTATSGFGNSLFVNSSGPTYVYATSVDVKTAGQYDSLITDASGNYTGWFGLVNTGNAKFVAGTSIYPSIIIGNSSGTILYRRALDLSITTLSFKTSSTDTSGSFFQSKTFATPKNLVALFDNTSGTGRPLYIAPVEYIANTGSGFVNRVSGYDSSNGAWNAILPNNNANGVKLIEQLSVTSGNLVGCLATDADGIWPTGNISTVNPTNGKTVKIISGNDDPLAPPTITVQPSSTAQSVCQNSAATALSVTATGGNLSYQWYSNTAASNTGGTLITGATSASYTPSTATAGTTYYYVVVSNTASCATTSNVFGAVMVNVTPTAAFTAPSYISCEGTAALVVINGTPNATVTYTIGGATQPTVMLNSSGSIALNSNTNPGTYNYSITNVALNTCSSTTPSNTTVTINPKPTVASITGPTNVAIGNSIALQDATTGGVWTIDASGAAEITSSNSSPATATIKGDAVGTATITYTITNGTTGCTNTATYSVNVYDANLTTYRTKADGNYSDISVWEFYNGTSYVPATTIPGNSNNISVRHTVLMDVDFDGTGSSTFAITSHVSGATTVNGNLTIAPNHFLSSAGGVDFGGNIVTVQSTAAGNGAIGQISGTIAGATNVTVERYTDGGNSTTGKRAWRLVTSPVTGVSINAAWQEGQVYNSTTGTNYLTGTTTAATKPVTYGTLITSDISTPSIANTNGYDFTAGVASLKQYTPGVASGAWVSLADNQGTTKAGTLQDVRIQPAYMLFVRGNRTIGSGTSSTITTLRATGTVNQGNQTIGVIHTGGNIREIAGNPYASTIDFSAVYAQNSSRILNKFAVWVSRLGTYGAYTYVAGNGDGTYTATPNSIDGSSGTTQPLTAARYIQSGEGFLVYPTGTATGDITVDETVKAPTQQATSTTTTFRLSPSTDKKLYVNLNLKDSDTSATLADGFLARFDATYDTAINEDDGTKQSNFNENLGILSEGNNLIVEARPDVQKTDTLHMNLWNVKQRAYQLQMKGDNWASAPGVHAYLVDNYLASKQEVALSGTVTSVNFTVNTDSASWKSDRFSIVFQNDATVLPVTLTSVKAAAQNGGVNVTWTVTNEQNIKTYTVERSINGGNSYTAIGSQQAKNQTAAAMTNYQSFDAAPQMGSNLYRIRIETKEGVVTYSSVVTVVIGQDNGKILITLYPNPVRPNGKVSLQMSNLATGTYLVNVYSQAGQTVYQKKITISQANTTQSEELKLGGSLAQGSYEVRISNSKGTIVYADKLVVGR